MFISAFPTRCTIAGFLKTMTEKEKAAAGQLYRPADPELFRACQRSKRLCARINHRVRSASRNRLLKKLLGHLGSDSYFEPPVYFDYGYNTFVGDHFYGNHNLTVLDTGRITIGDHVFIGPNVGLYAPAHPLDIETRNAGLESAAGITIGNNVWIGGSVCVLPGVRIGDGAVIGAGSVVTHDIPPNVVAVGNPCRPIRAILQGESCP